MRGWRRGSHHSHRRSWARVDEEGSRHDWRDVAVLQEPSSRSITSRRSRGLQKLNLTDTCACRAASALVIFPAVDSGFSTLAKAPYTIRSGIPRFTRLKALNTSMRSSVRTDPPTGIIFMNDKSTRE